ncbi:hypothetical protein DFH07DRAFT_936574 [Mycena maculata]|uniref:Secreted protein n=1 Tax=Mycena maculata TaxID=230809 RepID=A0AAD7K3X7_9AGAR|nr:hypothetical protein DFH07DRAFT_936574 [Mycena maculata]
MAIPLALWLFHALGLPFFIVHSPPFIQYARPFVVQSIESAYKLQIFSPFRLPLAPPPPPPPRCTTRLNRKWIEASFSTVKASVKIATTFCVFLQQEAAEAGACEEGLD